MRYKIIKGKTGKVTTALLLSALLVVFMCMPMTAYAQSLSINGYLSSGNICEGDAFTLTVKFKADSLDYVTGIVAYDTYGISYRSGGSSSGNGGVISLNDYSSDGRTITYEIKMSAIKAGTYDIVVKASEAYDADGHSLPGGSKTISVDVGEKSSGDAAAAEEEEPVDGADDVNQSDSTENSSDEGNAAAEGDKSDTSAEGGGNIKTVKDKAIDKAKETSDRVMSDRESIIFVGATAATLLLFIILLIVKGSRKRRNRKDA